MNYWRVYLLKIITRYLTRKRAISPVIAVILLIGLAVAAVAAIFLVVLPLLQPTTKLFVIGATADYDNDETMAQDKGKGYGKATVYLRNEGTTSLDIIDFQVLFKNASDEWEPITLSDPPVSKMEPEEIPPPTGTISAPTITTLFEVPTYNDDSDVYYKIILEDENGVSYDTTDSKWEEVEQSDMRLDADRPSISHSSLPTYIRGPHTFRPTLTDNVGNYEGIKNVSYHIIGTNVDFIYNITDEETSFDPDWTWNTRNNTQLGVDNASYSVTMTVFDYSGLNNTITTDTNNDPLNFTVDNDYVPPKISNMVGASSLHGADIAEVGYFFSVNATVTDSGSHASAVKEDSVFLHYKLNDSSTSYEHRLRESSTGDTWYFIIPESFIGPDAYVNNLTYYITAEDNDNNPTTSVNQYAGVMDTIGPDFSDHTFEGESVISQTTLEGDEGQTLSLSIVVEDEDRVRQVTMVWRERNDTEVDPQFGPWVVSSNYTGSGNTWEFRLPGINVTLDGLEYYFNATDQTNNTAYAGDAITPYRITVDDLVSPTINILSTIPDSQTEDTALTVTASISDNDLSFSMTGSETGTVKLGYQKPGESTFTETDMTHISGDSSKGETTIWEGIVPAGAFELGKSPITVRISATDDSGQTNLVDNQISIAQAGIPLLVYVADSMDVTGSNNHILNFDVKNTAGQEATANVTHMKITLTDNGKTILSGYPHITQIEEAGVIWQNTSVNEVTNDTQIELDTAFLFAKDATKTFTVTYANSSGSNYDLYDLSVTVIMYYKYGSSYDIDGDDTLDTFNTPTTQLIPQTETRYFRSNTATVNGLTAYDLGTSLSGSIALSDDSSTYNGDLAAQWGTRVYVRHSDFSQTDISGGIVATVQRAAGGDAAGMQQNQWNCPQTALSSSDAIVIEVWVQVGSNSPEIHARFVTEQLGADQLDASTWTIYYYTERDRSGGFFSRRTTATFHWGDGFYNSRITNFQYSTLGGGGSGSGTVSYSLSLSAPKNPPSGIASFDKSTTPTVQWIYKPLFLSKEMLKTSLTNNL
jgi:FlaG/FlaF family flagellin (archaellin)